MIEHRQTSTTVKVVICDKCGKDYRPWVGCCICERHFCRPECIVYDPRDDGDYPDTYCQRCWDAGDPYRQKQDELTEEYDGKMDALWNSWVKAAKAQVQP